MMPMGLLTKQDAQIIVESAGVDEGTQRRFPFFLGTTVFNAMKDGQLQFDIENASATKPAQVVGLTNNTTPATYGPEVTQFLMMTMNLDTPPPGGIFDPLYTIAIASVRQWIYSSDVALSPVTRKYRVYIRRPETLQYLGLIPSGVNNASKSAANNIATGTVDLQLHNCLSLKHLRIVESWISTLKIGVSELLNLETFMLTEHPNLSTITGKLPKSTKYIIIGEVPLITSINTLISQCSLAEGLYGGTWSPSPGLANALTSLTGTLEIAHMTALKEIGLFNNSGLSGINFPTIPANQWRVFQIRGSNGVQHISTANLLNALQSTSLVYFDILNGNKSWAQNIGNTEFSNLLKGINVADNLITGNITITAARLAVTSITLGLNQNEGNRFATIDFSGLNGGALATLEMSGVLCSNITLPASLPSLTALRAYDNEFDIVTNSDIVTKINGYTALTTLELSNFTFSAVSANHFGQNSTNGLGANPDFSGLVNCLTMYLAQCKITGTLTLPNVNKLTQISVAFNTGLTAFANLTAHTSILQIIANGATSLVFAITNVFTNLINIRASSTKITSLDLTGKTSTSGGLSIVLDSCPDLTEVKFPTAQNRAQLSTSSGQVITITNNPLLTSMVNMEQINWLVTGTTNNAFTCNGNALNITFPFGSNNFIPISIQIQNNGMSQANVDATLINLANAVYAGQYSVYSIARSINIAGSNAAPSGPYSAPGTPGVFPTGNEAAYYLAVQAAVTWTVTKN